MEMKEEHMEVQEETVLHEIGSKSMGQSRSKIMEDDNFSLHHINSKCTQSVTENDKNIPPK